MGQLADLAEGFAAIDATAELRTKEFADAAERIVPLVGALGKPFYFAREDFEKKQLDLHSCATELPTLRELVEADRAAGTLEKAGSHARNLDRLKNGIRFMTILIQDLLDDPSAKLSAAIAEAYEKALAPTHPTAIQLMVKASLWFVPKTAAFMKTVGESPDSLHEHGPKFIAAAKPVVAAVEEMLGGPIALAH
ncbi:unnamed protein product [Pedinophyceae sp. YPF-701]|nr:unnamed protein product [Pedinophyceae sp. YPF-701]